MSCDSLDIIPFKNKNKIQVNIPGSKSISNRALILAVLNNKPVKLNGILKLINSLKVLVLSKINLQLK